MLSKAIVAATIASLLIVLESFVLPGYGKSPTSQHKEGDLYVLSYTIVGGREYKEWTFPPPPDPDIRDYGISVTKVLGSSPRLGPGETYVVEGTYALTDPEYNVLFLYVDRCQIAFKEKLSGTVGQFRLGFRLPTDPLGCRQVEGVELENVFRVRLLPGYMYEKADIMYRRGGHLIGTPTMTIEILL